MKKITALLIAVTISIGFVKAQVDLTYQLPPKEILELADAPMAPLVQIDKKTENIVLLHRNIYSSIAELSEPELRFAV